MIKEIKYNGYTTAPSDYECQDGDLATCLNLVPDEGALIPVGTPGKVLELSSAAERVALIHSVPGQKNYILLRDGGGGKQSVFWQKKDESTADTNDATQIGSYESYRDIAIIGNTLAIATDRGVMYVLWKDDKYVALGNRPPFVSIDFGMYMAGTLSDKGDYNIPARCGPQWSGERGGTEKDELAEFTQMAYGLLLPEVADRVTSKGYFYMPFFVRYAFRMYDGTYNWHSAPILMLPTILPPLIKYADDGTHPDAGGTLKATLTLNVPYFGLAYRILSEGVDELAGWSDLVSGIDIFISAPLYTYDQSKDLERRPVRSTNDILGQVTCDWQISGGRPTQVLADEVFVGHYADTVDGKYVDHTMKTAKTDNADYYPCLNIKAHPDFHSNVESVKTFYKVAEIDIKDIKAMTKMTRLKFKNEDMSSLVTRPTLTDDYQSHFRVAASVLYAYNSRLNLAGITVSPAEPFPVRSIMQFGNPDGATASGFRVTVWTRLNGIRCYAVHNGKSNSDPDTWFNPAGNFPRYIFYPDASAYKMEIRVSDTEKYIIGLKPHDFLNGAYWYMGRNGMGKVSTPSENAEAETTDCGTSISAGSKIYTSEVNNPFYFPATGISTVGTGTVTALASAVRALSQGQFGQFPLYAFTTEGVWALEVSSTGGFVSRQPVTRDVCSNTGSITQIDSAVLFATHRGIMLLSGSQAQCISEAADGEHPFVLDSLPLLGDLLEAQGYGDGLNVAPFSDFISSCGMVYDYVHQRIIVFSPKHSYAYVYSLRSKQWGMTCSKIMTAAMSYPEALAVDSDCSLVDFSKDGGEAVKGLIVTRPVKLGEADILKTVSTMIQRGRFDKSHISTILYGSRDLLNWHLVSSSVSHRIVNRLGSPYKYFRMVLLCGLGEGESVYGCTVEYTPRFTNKPR